MKLLKYVGIVVLVLGLHSCKREMHERELLSNYEGNTYSEAFEAFWKGISTNYLFWDQEQVNWDSMYHAYQPKFDSLDMRPTSDTTMNLCFQYMVDMTKNLKDGQYAFLMWNGGNFRFEDSLYKSYISFIPKLFRTERIHTALPDTLFDYIIQNNYLREFDYGVYRNFNTGQAFQIITGRLTKGTKNVLYTSLNNFNMKESYDAPYPSRPTRPVIKNLFDNIHRSNCDAIIIDLRNNRGGNLDDIDFFGDEISAVTPLFPSAPDELAPQAHKVPSAFKAYEVWPYPASIFVLKPGKLTGVLRGMPEMLPSPICPLTLSPTFHMVPLLSLNPVTAVRGMIRSIVLLLKNGI